MGYNPNHPRVPKGSPKAGAWRGPPPKHPGPLQSKLAKHPVKK